MLVELSMALSHFIPLFLSDEEPIGVTRGLVNDLRPPIEAALEATDLVVALKPHLILDLLVDFVSYIEAPLHDKHDHIDVLKLRKNDCALSELQGLQQAQKEDHKIHVIIMLPPEVSMLHLTLQVWESKQLDELLQELLKQEVGVNTPLDIVGQLVEKLMVVLC